MLNPKIQDAFNKQINAELFSSYLYLSMSAYFESENFRGMAHWMRAQAGEENKDAMKFYRFIGERNGRVMLTQIGAPKTQWDSPADVFAETYKHELGISERINELMNLAIAEKDHAASSFLQWFVNEQVEEEASALTILEELKRVGTNGVALLMMDKQLAQRAAS